MESGTIGSGVLSARGTVFFVTVGGIAAVLGLELAAILIATGGHFAYEIEAAYTHLALAQQIGQGHYGLVPGEAAAPSSSILYPFLLAVLAPFGFKAFLPAAINIASTIATGVLALLLAEECGIELNGIGSGRLFLLSATATLSLNLAGLAFTGLEHSFHVACTVAYLLGLVRFIQRGRCDWWWFAIIIIQPLIRFEAAGMLVADAVIFIILRRYGYALAMLLIGLVLVGGYCLFLHALGLPYLPSSVLARSEWSNAAVGTHAGALAAFIALMRNFYGNLNSAGAAQILGSIAIAGLFLSRRPQPFAWRSADANHRLALMTIAFMAFVSFAQIAGGKLGWQPPRYEAYVLVLNLCGLAVVYREAVSQWIRRATWSRVTLFVGALLLAFAGYATQTLVAPALAAREYLGPYQLHRFVTEFYRQGVAVNQLGAVNYDNPYDVVDLSGLGSETARRYRAQANDLSWMDRLMAERHVSLAIITRDEGADVPSSWIRIAELRTTAGRGGASAASVVIYTREPAEIPLVRVALEQFAASLPAGARVVLSGSAR